LAGNVVSVTAVRVLGILSGIGVSAIIGSLMGTTGLGIYRTVTAAYAVVQPLALFGMDRSSVPAIARDPAGGGGRWRRALQLSTVTSLIWACVVVGWAWLSDGRPNHVALMAIGAFPFMMRVPSMISVDTLLGYRLMAKQVPAELAARITLITLVAVALVAGYGIGGVLVAQGVSWMVMLFLSSRAILGIQGVLQSAKPKALPLLRESAPFAGQALFAAIYLAGDILVIEYFRGEDEVGLYAPAALMMNYLPIVAHVVSDAMYPKVATHIDAPRTSAPLVGTGMRLALTLSLPIAIGGILLAPQIIEFLFRDPSFAPVVPIMWVLLSILPLRCLVNVTAMSLSALGWQKVRMRAAMVAAVFNIGLNILIVPEYGAMGAAWTTVASEFAIAAIILIGSYMLIGWPKGVGKVWRNVPALIAMSAVAWFLRDFGILVAIPAAVVAWAPLVWGFKAVTRDDIRVLRRL